MIIYAYSGLRPCSTTQSSKRHRKEETANGQDDNEIVKLRYADVALVLSKYEEGRTRFAMRPTFEYFKGGNRTLQQFVCYTLCYM